MNNFDPFKKSKTNSQTTKIKKLKHTEEQKEKNNQNQLFDPFQKPNNEQKTNTTFDPFQKSKTNPQTTKTKELKHTEDVKEKNNQNQSFDPFQKPNNEQKTNTTFDPFKKSKANPQTTKTKETKKEQNGFNSKFIQKPKKEEEEDDLTKQLKRRQRRRKGHKRVNSGSSSEQGDEEIIKEILKKKKEKQEKSEQEFDYFKRHISDLDKFGQKGEDLMGLGIHCAEKSCHKLDFLPFTCDLCKQQFCQEHWQAEDHDCKLKERSEKRIYICPICNNELQVEKGQDPNRVVDSHISNNCKTGIRKKRQIPKIQKKPQYKIYTGKTRFYHCSVNKCKQKEKMELKCIQCGLGFCLRHRNPISHNCKGKKPKPARKKEFRNKKKKSRTFLKK
ncbi:zinc finger an1-type domain 2a [Anaeramoeba flamelloides]|uniref:Zinc finger an1-type domain 2a n=1 Tax=Anaeramoeba flamelloides TaxID=1746091 RepID=A0AAV7Z9J1_9EUKA|nr:zinc finger an1-type domain 2a [Anaeramoeba flamelloides]